MMVDRNGISIEDARRAALVASGKPWLCSDWRCPAKPSCARHFWRSQAYAAMSEQHPPCIEPAREQDDDDCDHYERDEARPWLIGQPGEHLPVLYPPFAVFRS